MVWIVLASMAAGALISEMYHARMWNRYQQGKREGLAHREDMKQRFTVKR